MTDQHDSVVLGIDIGGTKIAAGLVDGLGRVHQQTRRATPAQQGGDAVLRAVTDSALAVVAGSDLPVIGCGVATGGTVDESGRVTSATSLIRDWVGTAVATRLADALGIPVRVHNDVHAAALAEARLGAARGAATAVVVCIGTGVGGAVVVDGEVSIGRTGTAGSIGHLPAPSASGRVCSCGARDHLEPHASGHAIEQAFADRAGHRLPLPEIASLARDGDQPAQHVISAAATMTGRVLAGVANLVDPDVIVIGGGVAGLGALLFDPIESAFRTETLAGPRRTVIRPAALGADSALVGAALAAPLPAPGRQRPRAVPG
ncbi:MAG: ROK family protein [Nocardioidaceae bacterium]